MNKLIRIDDSEFPQPDWIDEFENFNHLPKPYIRCGAHKFYATLSTWSPDYVEFRQVRLGDENSALCDTQIFWFHDTAYAIVIVKSEEPYFFRIGCEHKWQEIDQEECQKHHLPHQGKCYHVSKCASCGTIKHEDSSD